MIRRHVEPERQYPVPQWIVAYWARRRRPPERVQLGAVVEGEPRQP